MPTERGLHCFDAIAIGTGFGATVAAGALRAKNKRVLMLEHGLWSLTTERPVPPYIANTQQPTQYWPRPDHRDGRIDRCASSIALNGSVSSYQGLSDLRTEDSEGTYAS